MRENKIAKIVVGLPVEGPFDYCVPLDLRPKIKIGQRCWVSFGKKKMMGYVVGLVEKSRIKNLKPVLSLIDQEPILDDKLLRLTKEVAKYYCCSWSQGIEAALPVSLRKVRLRDKQELVTAPVKNIELKYISRKTEVLLLRDDTVNGRINFYLDYISRTLKQNLGIIVLSPQIYTVLELQKILSERLHTNVAVLHSRQSIASNLKQWLSLKNGEVKIVIGTCQAVFAPLTVVGLIIVDEEDSQNYKQDQTPHYHSRDVALMRAKIDKSIVILASSTPSLETYYQAKNKKIKLMHLKDKAVTQNSEIKLVDMRQQRRGKKRLIFSLYLENEVRKALENKGKIILFLNRRGFATYSFCQHCGFVLKCSRCNKSLTYKFDTKTLVCNYCNYKLNLPEICPECQSSYVRFWGLGTQRLESDAHRIFPEAKIKRWDIDNPYPKADFDILIATQLILRLYHTDFIVDLLGIVYPDASLNRIDFRAAEKTFALLYRLTSLARDRIIVQTSLPSHYCFSALLKRDYECFYREELKSRKELNLPPFSHIAIVNFRGRIEEKVKAAACAYFEKIENLKPKAIEISSPVAKVPSKLRGNFYYQILLKSKSALVLNNFIRKFILPLRHTGIIMTVDVDPV